MIYNSAGTAAVILQEDINFSLILFKINDPKQLKT